MPGDSQAGQLLKYMLGAQLKQLKKVVKSGILQSLRTFSGVFVDGGMVMVMSKLYGVFYSSSMCVTCSLQIQTVIADMANRCDGEWGLVFHLSELLQYAEGGLAKCIQVPTLLCC